MRLHILGLPHTITNDEYSHCAFTGKIKRFSPMMRSVGYEVIHYGVEGATSGASENIEIMSREEQESFIGRFDPKSTDFIGRHANWNSPLYIEFNKRLSKKLQQNVGKQDVICLPFGPGHRDALNENLSHAFWIESGIGYSNPYLAFRVYESYSHLHRVAGQEQDSQKKYLGSNYQWVVPNYYDLSEWEQSDVPGDYVLYIGRIDQIKGLDTVAEIAKNRPDLQFILAGQGNPQPFIKSKNVEYVGPVHGKERSKLFENAIVTLCPSKYFEPFCGVAVESMLCGTPVLSVAYGAFSETIKQGETGFRCRTLGDWLEGLNRIENWGAFERRAVAEYARKRYDMLELAKEYDLVFRQLIELGNEGWYSKDYYI